MTDTKEQKADYHDVAKNIWLLMFRAFKGGVKCDDAQKIHYEHAKRIAHENLDLGAIIRLMNEAQNDF